MYQEFILQLNNFDLIIILTLIMIFIFIILSDMRRQGRNMRFKTPEIAVQLLCKNCGFKEIRKFKEGDYISKHTDKCAKCGGDMIIDLIFIEETTTKKE